MPEVQKFGSSHRYLPVGHWHSTRKSCAIPLISDSQGSIINHHHFRHMLSLSGIFQTTTPGTPSKSELPLQPLVMASQNTSYVSWAAGPPKCTTASSVQISKISDLLNLFSSNWRFLGVRRCPGVAADSLQESPQHTRRTQKNHDLRHFVFLCFPSSLINP